MFKLILQCIWLGFPSAFANMTPSVAAKLLPSLNYPMDFYKTFKGKRILGEHKTIRGFVSGVIISEIIFILQIQLFSYPYLHAISIVNYSYALWYLGFVFGIGALGGDMIKSFFKRQFGIKEGVSWFPFDQIDFILGTLAILSFFVSISWQIIVTGILIGIILHLTIKFIGFTLGIENKPI